MGNYPPPYPPPPGPPYGGDWKYQRRVLKEQARAQRDILRVEGVVVGRDDELPIILRFRGHRVGMDKEAAACIHHAIAPEAPRACAPAAAR